MIGINKSLNRSLYDLSTSLDVDIPYSKQYWGTFTGFDKRPRVPTSDDACLRTVQDIATNMSATFGAMANYPNRDIGLNLYFITAWNEWNEQAVLEPDDSYKFGFLEAIRSNLRSFPVRLV
jgi:hypothetical protein